METIEDLEKKLLSEYLKDAPKSIYFDVQYYNKEHETLFNSGDHNDLISKHVSSKTEISTIEFLTYFLYTEQKDFTGYRYFKNFNLRLIRSFLEIKDNFKFKGHTIKPLFLGSKISRNIIEKYGVANSLSLTNNFFDLHEADWFGIPESNKYKTLDFDIAATEEHYIQVESKGTNFTDNKNTNSSKISTHKKSIIDKKATYYTKPKKNSSLRKDILIGIIGVMDKRTDSNAVCYLVDPPVMNLDIHPKKFKLLSRLNFYYYLISEVSQRSSVLALLANRINILMKLDNYEMLSGIRLIKNEKGDKVNPSLYNSRSIIKIKSNYINDDYNDIDVVGDIYHSSNTNELIFSGFKYDVLNMLIGQNHDRILNFKKEEYRSEERILVRVRKSHSIYYQLNKSNHSKRNDGSIELTVDGNFFFCKSGRVFGVISNYSK